MLKQGRYVDGKGKPLSAEDLVSSTAPPEYRLMAFKLVLECDEARFPTIVAELANSVMPLEVREVRINAARDSNAQVPGRRGGRDPGRPLAGPVGGQPNAGAVLHNATVEIWGIAYLVNPPDPKKVGLSESSVIAPAAASPANGNSATSPAASSTTGTSSTETAGAKEAASPDSAKSSDSAAKPGDEAAKTGDSTVPAKGPATDGAGPKETAAPAPATPGKNAAGTAEAAPAK
jgi:hypothetical protein